MGEFPAFMASFYPANEGMLAANRFAGPMGYDEYYYGQLARSNPMWAAKLMGERDRRQASFDGWMNLLNPLKAVLGYGPNNNEMTERINGRMIPATPTGLYPQMQTPIIGVRG